MKTKILIIAFLVITLNILGQNPSPFPRGIETKFVRCDTLTTAQRDALTPVLGDLIYHKDTGVSQHESYDGSAWVALGGFDETADYSPSGFWNFTGNMQSTGNVDFLGTFEWHNNGFRATMPNLTANDTIAVKSDLTSVVGANIVQLDVANQFSTVPNLSTYDPNAGILVESGGNKNFLALGNLNNWIGSPTIPDNQITVGTGTGIEGTENITYDGSVFNINSEITNSYIENESVDTRPVITNIDYDVNPTASPTSLTDYHGIDINMSFEGANNTTNSNIYGFEVQARNNATTNVSRLVSSYFLGENNSSGNVSQVTGLQLKNRTQSTGNITLSRNIWIQNPTNASTGTITDAYGIYIDDFTGGTTDNFGVYSLAKNYMNRATIDLFQGLSIKDSGNFRFNDNIAVEFGTGGEESRLYSTGSKTALNLLNGNFAIQNSGVDVVTYNKTTDRFFVSNDFQVDGTSTLDNVVIGTSFDGGSNKLTNLAEGTNPTDAVTVSQLPSNTLPHNEITSAYTFSTASIDGALSNNGGGDFLLDIPDNTTLDLPEGAMITFHTVTATDTTRVSFLNNGTRYYVKTKHTNGNFGETNFTLVQRTIDNWYPKGDFEFYTPVVVVPNVYAETNALSGTNNANSVTGLDAISSPATITANDLGGGAYSARATATGSGTVRMQWSFPVVNGETYTLDLDGFASIASEGFINAGFTNVTISSGISLTTSNASYTRTLTATATGTATMKVDLYNAVTNDYVELSNLIITQN